MAAKKRNIKDLKARLGRTITPQQGGTQGVVPPPSSGSTPPPPGLPGVGGVVPPFMRQKKPKAADPFGAAAQQAPEQQEVRLVIDDKAVSDAEVGREKSRLRRVMITGSVFTAVGIALGIGMGSMSAANSTYNAAVRDGKAVYEKVREASKTVTSAQQMVEKTVKAAKGKVGEAPSVDFKSIEGLRALEKPFKANDFARRKYGAFEPGTVDALFEYFNNVTLMWEKFESLANRTLPDARRKVLAEAAQAAGDIAGNQTGCVPMMVEEQFFCGLVFVNSPKEGQEPGTVPVATAVGSPRTFDKKIFTGQESLAEKPDDYVILTHTQRSVGVLGQQASAFAEYQRDILELKTLMDATMEVQGRLERGLGGVATLEERFGCAASGAGPVPAPLALLVPLSLLAIARLRRRRAAGGDPAA